MAFKEKLEEATWSYIGDANTMWDAMASCIRKVAKEVLGESRGKGPPGKETWWWSEEVQKAIRTKRDLYRDLPKRKDVETFNKYKEAKKEAKRAVDKGIRERWSYFEKLYNDDHAIEFDNLRSQGEPNVTYTRTIKVLEVKTAIRKMKKGKACGPDDILIDVWMALGDVEIVWLTKLFNEILKKKHIPDAWRKSILVLIFKNRDVLNCNNYKGIKLISHTMKLWEIVIKRRLRATTTI
ncbi:uncharacterized protein LOC112091130 [Morus notabilis]|uniref:uncharacterized protein LOC112091130 n=1 Tax=Morus notabilis TaxID=981085 RepID=UPI000CECE7D2|nr:uncharacterized protein LOC112091130 [Morus notabilis]